MKTEIQIRDEIRQSSEDVEVMQGEDSERAWMLGWIAALKWTVGEWHIEAAATAALVDSQDACWCGSQEGDGVRVDILCPACDQ